MIDLAIVVEGATEEMFVRSVLKAYLKCKDVDPEPFQIGAGRSGCGGNVTIDELASDMHTYYEFYGFNAVTSLVDFYGFSDEDGRSPDQLVEAIQNKLREISQNKELDGRFVFPYVQVYEFEGLLFSNVDVFKEEADHFVKVLDRLLVLAYCCLGRAAIVISCDKLRMKVDRLVKVH